jgi:hypothetical protein
MTADNDRQQAQGMLLRGELRGYFEAMDTAISNEQAGGEEGGCRIKSGMTRDVR